jgi:hypothetical protein
MSSFMLPLPISQIYSVPLRDICLPRLVPRANLLCSVPCRPRRFSRPRRFTPRMALWVYFTPLPRPVFTLQGFDSSSAASCALTQPLPSRRSFQLSYRQLPTCSTLPVRALKALLRVRIRNPITGG